MKRYTPGQEYKNGCKWAIESHSALVSAMEVLNKPSVCPSSVHITPGAAESNCQDLFCDFLYVIVRRRCQLHVTTDHFKQPNLHSTEQDKKFITRILEQCSSSFSRCTLVEFRGRLSVDDLKLLPTALVNLGLPISTPKDVAIVEMIMTNDGRMANIKELHLSLAKDLQAESVAELTQYCNARLCLHVSKVTDNNIEWLVQAVTSLDKPFGNEHIGVDEIYLPDSELTVKGLWELRRQFKNRHLKYPILVDADGIHNVAKKELIEDFRRDGNEITFNTSRKPFTKWWIGSSKLMTMKHGNMTSRFTGYINIYGFWIIESIVSLPFRIASRWFESAPASGNLSIQV